MLLHPNGEHVVVIAGGECYLVDIDTKQAIDTFGGAIISALFVPETSMVILGSPTNFESIGPGGRSWRSDRISWDGIRNVQLRDGQLIGEAWSFEDIWLPFMLDLATGKHEGGAETF